MAEPTVGQCPWKIIHVDKDGVEHDAWFQTALLVGDFAPGRKPIPNYVIQLDGDICEPDKTPWCGTCGKQPKVDDLTPIDRGNGARVALMPFRLGLTPWPAPTDAVTCYLCNDRGQQHLEDVPVDTISRAIVGKAGKAGKSQKKVKVCGRCVHFLEKSAAAVVGTTALARRN
jgi:hypothetical protein